MCGGEAAVPAVVKDAAKLLSLPYRTVSPSKAVHGATPAIPLCRCSTPPAVFAQQALSGVAHSLLSSIECRHALHVPRQYQYATRGAAPRRSRSEAILDKGVLMVRVGQVIQAQVLGEVGEDLDVGVYPAETSIACLVRWKARCLHIANFQGPTVDLRGLPRTTQSFERRGSAQAACIPSFHTTEFEELSKPES